MWVLVGLYFMFSNFYRLHLHNNTRVAIANLWWNICKNWTPFDLVMLENRKCMFVGFFNKYTWSSLLSVEWLLIFQDVVQSLLTSNVLCDHHIVVSNLLWPLWHWSGWFFDCFNYSSCSSSSLLCFAMWIFLI